MSVTQLVRQVVVAHLNSIDQGNYRGRCGVASRNSGVAKTPHLDAALDALRSKFHDWHPAHPILNRVAPVTEDESLHNHVVCRFEIRGHVTVSEMQNQSIEELGLRIFDSPDEKVALSDMAFSGEPHLLRF